MSHLHPIVRAIAAGSAIVLTAMGQTALLPAPHARVAQFFDQAQRVALRGNVNPRAAAVLNASLPADDGLPMEHMILHLKGDATQETQLAELVRQQNDPNSPLFHKFLTPEEFGAHFGVAAADLAKVVNWLEQQGFAVEDVPAGNRAIIFSGTSGQVTAAFRTEMRRMNIAGQQFVANAADPQIPVGLAEVVGGIVKLHNFKHAHSITKTTPLTAEQFANSEYTSGSGHYLAPADYGIIYDINPLYSAGIDGTGQSIAILARSNISLTDVQNFRSMFGLATNNPQIVITNRDPGVLSGDSTETILDTEWSGAVAPKAAIKVIVSASTYSADGIDLSALYAVNNNVAPVISLSYGACEAGLGSTEVSFYNSLWQQAAAQGQSVMVSSGDSGAAGCSGGSASSGSGAAINGLCSSPYATCVGGTQFVEGSNPGQYWLPGNNTVGGSAISYIPETVWNESRSNGGSGLWGGGGGVSIFFNKPAWQTGIGVPSDGKRDVPDISLSASGHDGYLIYQGGLGAVGGTSASAPSFAGLVALVDQKTGARQGLVNSVLYPLAARQASGGAAIFHDITTGNNTVPGVSGFSATTGYDLATGLGTVDAAVMVNHWTDAQNGNGFSLSASPANLTITIGQASHTTLSIVGGSTLTSAVSLTVSGAPAGVTASLAAPSIASSSATDVLNVSSTTSTTPGTYTLTVTGTSGNQTATVSITLVISGGTFTLAQNKTSLVLPGSGTAQVLITATPQTAFNAGIAFTVTGAPTGMNAAFIASTIAAPGTGSVTLNVSNGGVTPGTYPLSITGVGGGQTVMVTVTVVVPNFTLSATASVSGLTGSSLTVAVGVAPQAGFTANIGLSVSGVPTGVTATFSASSLAGTSSGSSTLLLQIASTATPGSYALTITGTGGGVSKTAAVTLNITQAGSCTLVATSSAAASTLSLAAGDTASGLLSCGSVTGSFSAPLTIKVGSVPSGVTVQTNSSLTAGGQNSFTVKALSTMATTTFNLSFTASSGSFSKVATLPVTVNAAGFALTTSAATVSVATNSTAQQTTTVTHTGAFNLPVSLSWGGLPTGVTATLSKTSLAAPGDGSTVTTFAASSNATPGTYVVTLTAASSTMSHTMSISLTITRADFALSGTPVALTLAAGNTGQQTVTVAHQSIFNAAVGLAWSGLPSGITAALAKLSLAAPGDGSSITTFSVGSSVAPGTYHVLMTATGGGITHTLPVTLTITAPLVKPSCTLTVAYPNGGSSLTGIAGIGINTQVTCTGAQGINSPLALSLRGAPSSIIAQLDTNSMAVSGHATLTIFAPMVQPATSFNLVLSATSGTFSQTLTIPVAISAAGFILSGPTTVAQAGTAKVGTSTHQNTLTVTHQGGFNADVMVSWVNLPTGVTATFSRSTLPAPGDGTTVSTFTVGSSVAAQTYVIYLQATGGGQTQILAIPLTVTR